jgi:hypothetical protein
MINERDDYPLSTWIIDLRDIIAKREFIEKKDALLIIVEDIVEFLEMYEEGLLPQAAYKEMIE